MFWFSVLVQLLVTIYPHTAMGTNALRGGSFSRCGFVWVGSLCGVIAAFLPIAVQREEERSVKCEHFSKRKFHLFASEYELFVRKDFAYYET